MDVYIEPLPRGQWGPIDGYSLEFADGSKFTHDVFRSELLAISDNIQGAVPNVSGPFLFPALSKGPSLSFTLFSNFFEIFTGKPTI